MPVPLFLLAVSIVPPSDQTAFRQPQLATDGKQIVVAFGAGNTIYFSASNDRGATFSPPVVVSNSGRLSLGRHRGPRIAISAGAIVISAILGAKGGGADGDLVSWRSTDGGTSWSGPTPISDVAGSAREGLHAMAGAGEVLFASWLDLRTKGTKLYGAVSRDGGASWSPNRLLYESPSGTVCECCHPSLAIDSRGRIALMFRNSIAGSRDLYFTESPDGKRFSPARKLGDGTWPLQGCPMDGGAIAFSPDSQPVTVWRRDKQIFTSGTSGPERSIASGKDPVLAIGKTGPYFAWTASPGVLVLWPGSTDPIHLSTNNSAGYPQLLPLADGTVLASWEDAGRIEFRLLP